MTMIRSNLNLKNLLTLSLLLGLAGCGCNDDSTLTTLPRNVLPAVLGVRSVVPPVPVVPPPVKKEALRIDVAVVMDDSDGMVQALLGIIPNNLGIDQRPRAFAAQAILEQLEQNLRARLVQEWVADGIAPEDFPLVDFAFAVARFEDFGGEFTSLNRRKGGAAGADDPDNSQNDMDARPFILNMPILRQAHPQFADLFEAALAREAPGDGNPFYGTEDAGIPINEPQSALEALYQVAAPRNANGTFGGFDADGNGSTLDSGAPTSLEAARNPQTRPGASGDVPAIAFTPLPDKDDDEQAVFAVTGEDGTPVTIPNPAGGAAIPSISSGNLGGVGWRENSARFVILVSDIATVAPTTTEPQGTPRVLRDPFTGFTRTLLPPPAINEMVSSVDGDLTPTVDPRPAPRQARTTLLGAFDSGFQIIANDLVNGVFDRRIGIADGPIHAGGTGVAPIGAHTVQQTVDALNQLDIEVLCMGTPSSGRSDTKPGDTGVNGDIDSDVGNKDYDPSNPAIVKPDLAPWFYFNAVTRLSMPEVTSIPLGGGEALFPAVYNIATVWPLLKDAAGVPLDPTGATKTGIKNTVTDDLIERVRDWVETPYLTADSSTTAGERPATLPRMSWKLVIDFFPPQEVSDVIQIDPTEAGVPVTHFESILSVPTYWTDDAVAPGNLTFTVPNLTFLTRDETVPLPSEIQVPFKMTAQFVEYTDVTPENTPFLPEITEYIKLRGDGTNPLASEHDAFTQAEGTVLITVRSGSAPGPGAQLVTWAYGSGIINDFSIGGSAADQIGGTGEAFPPPPAPPITFLRRP
jgi:hypothetical protein